MKKDIVLFVECHWFYSFCRSAGSQRIATELRNHGYSVQVIEFFGLFNQLELDIIIQKYVGENTLAVGFSSTNFTASNSDAYYGNVDCRTFIEARIIQATTRSYGGRPDNSFPFENNIMLELIRKIKAINPKIKIIYGGSKAQNQMAKNIDCNFISYADHHIINYVNQLQLDKLAGIESELSELKTITYNKDTDPFIFKNSVIEWEEDDYVFPNEVVPIEVSRGCIFRCKFCSFPLNGKSNNDYVKDMDILYQELITNYERHGITTYIFSDDTFNDSTEKLERILSVVKRLPFRLRFTSYLRLDLLRAHPKQIHLLQEIGLQFAIFGIESLNQKTLQTIGKKLNFEKLKQILTFIRNVWGNDVITYASFIFGLPFETKESLDFQAKWIIEEGLDYLHDIKTLPFFISRSTDADINKSDISKNPFEFGFDYEPREGKSGWHNKTNDLYFSDMLNYSDQVNNKVLVDPRRRYGGFAGGMFANTGISFEELVRTPFIELPFERSLEGYTRRLSEYKAKVL